MTHLHKPHRCPVCAHYTADHAEDKAGRKVGCLLCPCRLPRWLARRLD